MLNSKGFNRYLLASDLREKGKTFTEISKILGVCYSRARDLAHIGDREKKKVGNEFFGLHGSVSNALQNRGFRTKQQVLEAWQQGKFFVDYKGGSFPRIGKVYIREICEWLGFEFKEEFVANAGPPIKILKAIKLLKENGYEVIKI